jgi:hypothetical protein
VGAPAACLVRVRHVRWSKSSRGQAAPQARAFWFISLSHLGRADDPPRLQPPRHRGRRRRNTAPPRPRQAGRPASRRETPRSVEANSRLQKQRPQDAETRQTSRTLAPRSLTCSVEEQEREIWLPSPERLLLAVATDTLAHLSGERAPNPVRQRVPLRGKRIRSVGSGGRRTEAHVYGRAARGARAPRGTERAA